LHARRHDCPGGPGMRSADRIACVGKGIDRRATGGDVVSESSSPGSGPVSA
jgi:hypothetical protein